MLTDREYGNLARSPSHHQHRHHHPVVRDVTSCEGDNNVFEETSIVCTPPVSPRSGPMPGIIVSVESEGGQPQEFINMVGRHGSRSKTRSSRRNMQSSTHRSPSGSRMARQNGHKLRDPNMLRQNDPTGVSRSQSVRTPRRPQSVDPSHRFRQRIASIPNDMTLPSDGFSGQRLASNQSLPLPGDESDVLRLRNFAVTNKGVVNRGDSFRSKSRSAHSVASINSGQMPAAAALATDDSAIDYPSASNYATAGCSSDVLSSDKTSAELSDAGASALDSMPKTNRYRVLVLGSPDVGKTALINQFMTSEYICAYDNSQDEENEKSVGVILNGTESELVFLEHQFLGGESNTNLAAFYNPDAYLVVYSVTSKRTLQVAKEILRLIHRWDNIDTKAVILVGNKTDLARLRVLSTDDGRSLAIEEGSKFIETSAGINHHVDELLVGILSQIRLKLSSMEHLHRKRESVSLGSSPIGAKLRGGRCSGCAACKAKGILKRILKKACSRSKSCDNLHVL